MSRPLALLIALGACLFAATLGGLLLHVPVTIDADAILRAHIFVALSMLGVVAYLLAVRLVLRSAWPRATLWGVLGLAVLLRVMLLTEPPFLSTDIYRYVWDGRVQAAGINPYRYVPTDPALVPLRDEAVFPNINRASYAHTIYPPVAQFVFAAVGRVADSVMGMRLAMLGFEALGVVCALALLHLARLPRERILIYAWNPLPLWAFASDGHVDAVAVGFLGMALLLRARRRDGWAGAALAAATLVKFFPLVVAPAFLRGGRFWPPVLAGLATIVLCYAVYLGAGTHVLGFLPAYGQEEGFTNGSGFWLLSTLDAFIALPSISTIIYAAVAAIALAALTLTILRQEPSGSDVRTLCRDTGTLAGAAMIIVSPHYYWYFAWLALPAVIAPSRALLWLSTSPLLLISNPLPSYHALWPSLIYVPAILLWVLERRQTRHTAHTPLAETGDIACPLQSS